MFRRFSHGLCTAVCLLLALTSCQSGITDPIGEVSSDIEPWAPVLSAEEADALFGRPSTSNAWNFYGDYVYYTAPLSAKSSQFTVYRYNIETGVEEYVCTDPTCTHMAGSSCPFARVESSTQICAAGEGIAYCCGPGIGVEWYNCKTGEHKYLSKDGDNCYRVGDTVYYDFSGIGFDPDDPHKFMHQLWRVDDVDKGTQTLAAQEDETVEHINPYELDGRELIVAYSIIDPAGNPTGGASAAYLYSIDPETDEHRLMNDRSVSDIRTAGTHYLYYSVDTSVWEEDDTAKPPCELCLTDAATGETVVLAGSDEVESYTEPFALTDRCAFWLKDDPENENGRLLHCYDYVKGEKTVYPLEGKWTNGIMTCYRGRIYFFDAAVVPVPGEIVDNVRLVIWDILTGKQHVLRDGTFTDA